MFKVAVYGTLRKGFRNHHVMQKYCQGRCLDEYTTLPGVEIIIDYRSGLPFAIESTDEHDETVCELYEVSEEGLDMLDHFEGEGVLYFRKRMKTTKDQQCFVYMGKKEELIHHLPIKQDHISDFKRTRICY